MDILKQYSDLIAFVSAVVAVVAAIFAAWSAIGVETRRQRFEIRNKKTDTLVKFQTEMIGTFRAFDEIERKLLGGEQSVTDGHYKNLLQNTLKSVIEEYRNVAYAFPRSSRKTLDRASASVEAITDPKAAYQEIVSISKLFKSETVKVLTTLLAE
jgi:hypothetical protein